MYYYTIRIKPLFVLIVLYVSDVCFPIVRCNDDAKAPCIDPLAPLISGAIANAPPEDIALHQSFIL